MYHVLLYYKYVPIDKPDELAAQHFEYCKQLGLKGRILFAEEGVNGTCSGTLEQTKTYMKELRKDKRFKDISFKIDYVEKHVFKKLFVRHKKEIVTFRANEKIEPNKLSGKHLSPKKFLEKLKQEDTVILDGRTDYEYDLGHFRNAIRPDVKSFREFSSWLKKNFSQYKDKPVLTYCTGGIRCEKLSGYLMKKGFKEVYQLDGGIVSYSQDKDVKGKLFEGKCYVFDERISIPVNFAEEYKPTGKCHHCGTATDRYVNCANLDCHKQHFECEACEKKWFRSCSEECIEAERHELIKFGSHI